MPKLKNYHSIDANAVLYATCLSEKLAPSIVDPVNKCQPISQEVVVARLVRHSNSDQVIKVTCPEMGARLENLANTIPVYPTLGEATMEAAMASLGHATHV